MPDPKEILLRFIPPASFDIVTAWLTQSRARLKITRERSSKYDDYTIPNGDTKFHRITINYNLNPYSFLITLAHEVAHLKFYEKFNTLRDPHGENWKEEYRRLLLELNIAGIFPEDIQKAVAGYVNRIKASARADRELHMVLRRYDRPDSSVTLLEQLPEGALFSVDGGRIFRKGKKLRTWYSCTLEATNRKYRVNPMAEVTPLPG
jgi:hypothetical protein